eukprot:CAMPEP_0175073562 /NCGR_PEP_ID=MMETSP0052_2-20121109/20661_1 /TAXON_ID=51329 ORGANISM="Polytomella parva, Strain SAG 63-3" /NCGR_SAMPLE_ID=MMETSP0052_2 /ASSEMBLY_ACC=CAM_ASM_000194 /LENGTH=203 /DNA_ID=CAMNT_0016341445 /DNA_START=32 /DNA_END=639 /DNA_ORIENTATION=+
METLKDSQDFLSAPAEPEEPTSRICVKNIPKYVDEKRLNEFFSQKGDVTDVKILRTTDGRSRQLGFVGFRTEAQAAAAQKYFNRSYMDTCSLSVEFARRVGDGLLPRPWSKYSSGSSSHEKKDGPVSLFGKGPKSSNDPAAKASSDPSRPSSEAAAVDPNLAEFMGLMKARVKAKIWANDELVENELAENSNRSVTKGKKSKA